MLAGIVERSEYMMDTMNDIVWSINPQHDEIGNVLVRMKEYAAEMLEPAGIEYRFVMDEKTLKTKLDLSIRKDIYLIFKEGINNMAKHAHCHKAVIELKYHHNVLEMILTDDGVGFIPEEMKGKGNGLPNLQERARQINGEVTITSTPGSGTEIRLQVPVT
jgi:signal transduction histidine kinase